MKLLGIFFSHLVETVVLVLSSEVVLREYPEPSTKTHVSTVGSRKSAIKFRNFARGVVGYRWMVISPTLTGLLVQRAW